MEKTSKGLECPCCGAKLFFDPARNELRTQAPGVEPGKGLSLDAAVAAIQAERAKADEKFRAAFEKEGRRRESLEKKFEEALRDSEGSTDPRPLRDIDLD